MWKLRISDQEASQHPAEWGQLSSSWYFHTVKYYAAINILEKKCMTCKNAHDTKLCKKYILYIYNIKCIYLVLQNTCNTFHMYMHRGKNEGNELKRE